MEQFLSLGGDTSVRLKHRQGRRQRQVLVMETVKVQKRLITDIDLRSEFYYDSFIETHATPDESPIIAKSYTELLEKLVSNEEDENRQQTPLLPLLPNRHPA